MQNIRIAFFDIDGTLIDMKKKVISPKMIETLQRLQKNKILIVIATGRSYNLIPQFDGVEFDAFLSFNASFCCTKNEVIYKEAIPQKDVQQIIENTRQINRPVALASFDQIYANGTEPDLVDYFAFSKNKVEVINNFDEFSRREIYQIMCGGRKDEYSTILKDVKGAHITAWWDRAVDIIPANCNKGLGVEKILDYYHFSKEQAIAFGDGANDIDMLEAVEYGIAMENATDDVKAIAYDQCGHVNKDGIYYYCLQHHLI